MKLVIVNRHVSDVLGGSEMQCDNIANELTRRGCEVTYVAPGGNPSRLYERPYKIVPVPARAESIASAVRQAKPDIVYWRFNKNHFFRAVRSIKGANIPVVFAVSHIDDTRRLNFLANPRSGVKQAAKAVKQAIVNAYNYRGFGFVDAVTYLNPDFMGLLPVPIEAFVPNSVSEQALPFTWRKPFVIWVANLKKAKRPELFLKLAKELKGENVDFIMVGAVMALTNPVADDGSNPDSFFYLGPKSVEEVNGMISESLALVHTCLPEGFGNNFLQAWLAGKPTVSLGFDPGGYIEKHDLGGMAHENWNQFVQSVRQIVQDRDLANDMGKRALSFARANFSIERTVDELVVLFESLPKRVPALLGKLDSEAKHG